MKPVRSLAGAFASRRVRFAVMSDDSSCRGLAMIYLVDNPSPVAPGITRSPMARDVSVDLNVVHEPWMLENSPFGNRLLASLKITCQGCLLRTFPCYSLLRTRLSRDTFNRSSCI